MNKEKRIEEVLTNTDKINRVKPNLDLFEKITVRMSNQFLSIIGRK